MRKGNGLKDSELQEAYRHWQALMPCIDKEPSTTTLVKDLAGNVIRRRVPAHFNGNCCFNSHVIKGTDRVYRHLPDEKVCPRERAWRKYVRIRDDNEAATWIEPACETHGTTH